MVKKEVKKSVKNPIEINAMEKAVVERIKRSLNNT